jgi:hypothetical protein
LNNILPRKVISASVTGTLFSILLGFTLPYAFGEIYVSSFQDYLVTSSTTIPMYLVYSFPAILLYGVFTSIISDTVGDLISIKFRGKQVETIVSGVLHIIFGLILFWISLIAALIFFIIDRAFISRKKEYKWFQAFKSLAFPLLTWLLFMGIVWGNEIFH